MVQFPLVVVTTFGLAVSVQANLRGKHGVFDKEPSSACHLDISMANKELVVGNQIRLSLSPRACVRSDGEEVCVEYAKSTESHSGVDALGTFREVSEFVDVGDEGKQWKLSHRAYPDDPTTLMFGQHFLDKFEETNFPAEDTKQAATEGMASWFPSFTLPTSKSKVSNSTIPQLGFLEFNGMFVGEGSHQIAAIQDIQVNNALTSGPIAIFSDECVVIMSSASQFMDSSSMFREDLGAFGFGVMGSITTIPKGHRTSTIVSSFPRKGNGPDGIRQAFSTWGAKLQKLHNTHRMGDATLDYLQYSTDNGAYYYYHKEEGQNYQETILSLKEHIEEIKLPVKSWLMDSWWYFKGKDGGVKEWVARPNVFPDGILNLRQKTGWMMMAHNRFWSNETVYAKQNGGDFEFVIEKYGLPLEQEFWDWFFAEAKKWGLDVYEQDWLNYQTQYMNYTLQYVNTARTWLSQMGIAAKRHNIPIQYCMSWPRHILQSLEIDAVTQARGSDDVLPNDEHSIQLGLTNMFSYAVGLAPHKDSFWSTPVDPPANPYAHYEEASTLLSVIATYSMGPVTPSDKIGYLNVDLIMKGCSQDGTILKPDLPAVRTDATILAEAGFSVDSQQRNQVWVTKSELSGYTWTYVLSATSPEFELTGVDIYPSHSNVSGYSAWQLNAPSVEVFDFPGTIIPATNRTNIQVYGIAPAFDNGWTLLGEAITKWTTVSRNRFSDLVVDDDGFSMTVTGAPNEVVEIWLISPDGDPLYAPCTLPRTGRSVFELLTMGCAEEEVHESNAKTTDAGAGAVSLG